MKRRLVDLLRCPRCRATLALGADAAAADDIVAGTLTCRRCAAAYPVRDGIPRLLPPEPGEALVVRTAETFGYSWAQPTVEPTTAPIPWHYVKMERALRLDPAVGLVLDAGCGDGIDLANMALRPGVEVIGVDVSDGGVAQSRLRARHLPNAHVVQGDLRHLPFADDTFDAVYSYGVLHHVPQPDVAARELARVASAGAPAAIYLYEHFVERGRLLHLALTAVNAARPLTTRLSPAALMRLCRIASPIVYLLCAVPYRALRRWRLTRALAESIPFRHARTPFGLAGDLFDRFGAPVEFRYTRSGASALLEQAGFDVIAIANDRGWMVAGRKPEPDIMRQRVHADPRT